MGLGRSLSPRCRKREGWSSSWLESVELAPAEGLSWRAWVRRRDAACHAPPCPGSHVKTSPSSYCCLKPMLLPSPRGSKLGLAGVAGSRPELLAASSILLCQVVPEVLQGML